MTNKLKIEFAPGCFDHFEGSQEELDELIKSIHDQFENMTTEDFEQSSMMIDGMDITEDELESMLDHLVLEERNLH
jgi:hypothetical protein